LDYSVDRLGAFIESCRVDNEFRYSSGEPASLLATCFAVLVSESSGSLQFWTENQRQGVANSIVSSQSAETGYFGEDLVDVSDLVWKNTCDRVYVVFQITYFALSALRALGVKKRYPLKFLEPFFDIQYARGWVAGGNWHDPWNMSNRAMFLIRFLMEEASLEVDGCESLARQLTLDLRETQDPRTGFWHGQHDCSDSHAAFAAYHFFPFMFHFGIAPHHVEKSIDTVLSIQNADGHYGPFCGGGGCEDLDAIDILVTHSILSSHRAKEVRESLLKSHRVIAALQNADGGFPNYTSARISKKAKLKRAVLGIVSARHRKPLVSYYSGWKKVGAEFGKSDLWGTWFRLHSLQLIESRYPDVFENAVCQFHSFPALGWHSPEKVLKAKEDQN